MQKKFLMLALVLGVLMTAVFVYAWTYDTDGGYNIYERGICYVIDNGTNSSYTDYCMTPGNDFLKEYAPYGNSSCKGYKVFCQEGCSAGACIEPGE